MAGSMEVRWSEAEKIQVRLWATSSKPAENQPLENLGGQERFCREAPVLWCTGPVAAEWGRPFLGGAHGRRPTRAVSASRGRGQRSGLLSLHWKTFGGCRHRYRYLPVAAVEDARVGPSKGSRRGKYLARKHRQAKISCCAMSVCFWLGLSAGLRIDGGRVLCAEAGCTASPQASLRRAFRDLAREIGRNGNSADGQPPAREQTWSSFRHPAAAGVCDGQHGVTDEPWNDTTTGSIRVVSDR